jgi:hypothetical protein
MGNTIGTSADTPHHHHGVIKKRLLRWENSGFSQRINNSNDGGGELRSSNNNYNNNNAADDSNNTQRKKIQQLELQLHSDTTNLKLYFIFGALLTFIGFVLSIVGPVMSCSFGIITWSDDNDNIDGTTAAATSTTNNNNNPAYQSTITNVGLFTWYNPTTSTCYAYSPLDTQYFYVDGTARGMAIASLVFGVCALLWILGWFVSIFILGRSDIDQSGDSNNSSSSNNSSGSIKLRTRITFLTLAGLTLLASITQISTLSYFQTKKNEDNDNYAITCNNYTVNGKEEGNCSKGIGAHDAIISFLFYLFACVVYTIVAVKCFQVNNEKNKRGGGKGGKKKKGGEDDEELYKSTIDVHKCTSASCNCNNGGLENVSFIPVAASNDTKKSGDELTRQAKMAATTTGGVVGSTTATTNTVNKEYEYWYPEASRISDEGSYI